MSFEEQFMLGIVFGGTLFGPGGDVEVYLP